MEVIRVRAGCLGFLPVSLELPAVTARRFRPCSRELVLFHIWSEESESSRMSREEKKKETEVYVFFSVFLDSFVAKIIVFFLRFNI